MTELFMQLGLLLTGWGFHVLAKLYELNKASVAKVGVAAVMWEDAERWRTIMLLLFMGVTALTGQINTALSAAGIVVDDATGLSIILISVGYNIDSISTKILSLAKTKPGEQ